MLGAKIVSLESAVLADPVLDKASEVEFLWEQVVIGVTAARGPFQPKSKTGKTEELVNRACRLLY